MSITISPNVLKETTSCVYNFRCMSGELHRLCPGDRFQGSGEVLFVLSGNGDSCPYHIELSESVVCACPVRKELYKRYGV
jgi:hypothetical protein